MTRLRLVGFVIVLAGGVVAWEPSRAAQTSPAETAVMQAIDQINGAFQRRDVKAYESLTTADFVRVGSNGRIFGRSEWLKRVAAPGPERGPGRYDEVKPSGPSRAFRRPMPCATSWRGNDCRGRTTASSVPTARA